MQLPSLNKQDVNVFIMQLKADDDPQQTAQCLAALSPEERRQQQKFHFAKDRQLYLHAHAMLRRLLSAYVSCAPQDLVFETNAYGKPALKHPAQLSFNLSHAHQGTALVIAADPQLDLGVDIEHTQDRGELISLADHYFSASEAAWLKQQPKTQQGTVFFKLWTLKEAYIKAIGKGLSIDLNSFSFHTLDTEITIDHGSQVEHHHSWFFAQAMPFEAYQMAVAVRNTQHGTIKPNIRCFAYQADHSCAPMPLKFVNSSQF